LNLGFFFVFFYDLTFNNMTLILDFDMNVSVSIETHVTYNKSFILGHGMRPL
jgi:hypothetical protein